MKSKLRRQSKFDPRKALPPMSVRSKAILRKSEACVVCKSVARKPKVSRSLARKSVARKPRARKPMVRKSLARRSVNRKLVKGRLGTQIHYPRPRTATPIKSKRHSRPGKRVQKNGPPHMEENKFRIKKGENPYHFYIRAVRFYWNLNGPPIKAEDMAKSLSEERGIPYDDAYFNVCKALEFALERNLLKLT